MVAPHVPTDENRRLVEHFSVRGVHQKDIASYLRINVETLLKYYVTEINNAKADRNAVIGQNVYQRALDGDWDAMVYWTKCQAKWSYYKEPEEKEDTNEALMKSVIELAQAQLLSAKAKSTKK